MKRYATLAMLLALVTGGFAQQKNAQNGSTTMNKAANIASETADNIVDFSIICRYDDTDSSFYLMFDVDTYSKKVNPKSFIGERHMMRVTQIDTSYQLKLQLQSSTFYENGANAGHGEPSGAWVDDSGMGAVVLKHYLLHQSTIPVHTKKVDISRWKPLFTLSQNESDQYHVLKLALVERYPGGHFTLSCELLGVINVLVNNELANYAISTHTLYFTLIGGRYYVRLQHNTTTTYTNGGRDVKELTVPPRVEETRPADEILFSRKVLEYYLAHQSEFEVGAESK